MKCNVIIRILEADLRNESKLFN